MPLANPPLRGYSEFQRLANWDSGPLYARTGNSGPGIELSGVQDVSRYACLAGFDIAGTIDVKVSFSWYADAAAATWLGTRAFQLSPSVAAGAQYRLPNLGPYVQGAWQAISGAAFAHTVELLGTNRSHPLELIPQAPVLIDQQGAALPGSSTVIANPSDYYAGPVGVYASAGQVAVLTFQYLTQAGAWDTFVSFNLPASGRSQFVVTVPPGAWRASVFNTTATATTFTLACVPSTTGAN